MLLKQFFTKGFVLTAAYFFVFQNVFAADGNATDMTTKTYPGNRKGTVVHNSLIKFGVVPSIGGRIVELGPVRREVNFLGIKPWNFAYGTNDKWPGAEYGGICDTATTGWPGPFWGIDYEIQHIRKKGTTGLKASASAEGKKIERTMTLPDKESRLVINTKQYNIKTNRQTMVIRLHGEFAVGEIADSNDFIYWEEDDELKVRHYIPGSEAPRFSFDTVTGRWAAMVDSIEKEALIHYFRYPDPPHRVMYWSGHPLPPAGTIISKGDTGWYNNERIGEQKSVGPGDYLETTEEFWIIKGLSRVDLCTQMGAGMIELEKHIYGNHQDLIFTAAFGSYTKTPALKVEAFLLDSRSEPVKKTNSVISETRAGLAGNCQITFSLTNLENGTYSVKINLTDSEDRSFGHATRHIEINNELVKNSYSALKKSKSNISNYILNSRHDKVGKIRAQVLDTKYLKALTFYEKGLYRESSDISAEIREKISFYTKRLTTKHTGKEKTEIPLDELLNRYRNQPAK